MSDVLTLELQKAIAAAHAGEIDQARMLADQVIQEDPENENALYLMSALADSDEERQAYLSQVLIVNPDHPGAQKYMAEFDEASIVVDEELAVAFDDLDDDIYDLEDKVVVGAAAAVTAEELQDIVEDTTGLFDDDASETVPDWLLDDEEIVDEKLSETEGDADVDEMEQVPDWLTDAPSVAEQEESEQLEELIKQELVDQEPVPVPVEPVPKHKPAAQKGPSDRVLTIILVLLIIVAVVIVGGIIFLAITRPLIS
ncbi:MAG: hypothetical protein BMS9Abin02_0526 [Anaerolineae bacterium]|nr:MAG: hypothetical protein BMS9Abin02_0526 [Anaerolineae bacterium]